MFLDEPSACAINVNLLINQKYDVTISTSLQVLQYLGQSTRVLAAQYWSTDGEVLDFVLFFGQIGRNFTV